MKLRILGCLLFFAVLSASATADSLKLGLAYDVSRDGHGFDLHKAGDTYVLFFYTYDDRGFPEWLLGTGEMRDGVISGELNRYLYEPGTPSSQYPDPNFTGFFSLDASEEAVAGACNDDVDRRGADNLTAFYWETNGDIGVWCTQKLFGGDNAVGNYRGGVWFAGPDDDGYGYSMSQQGQTLAAVVYYYDAKGNPVWSLGTGTGTTQSTIELDSYLGFCRTCTPKRTVGEDSGTLRLNFEAGRALGSRGRARLTQEHTSPPFGNFDRNFDLFRLTDGEARVTRRIGEMSTQSFYNTFISPFIVQKKCVNCHVEGGPSGSTRLVFERSDASRFWKLNFEKFEALVEDEGGEYILTKARGGEGHGGGVQLPGDSLEFRDLTLFFEIMGENISTPPPTAEAGLFTDVSLLSWEQTLRKAALLFAGRLPTDAERATAQGNNETAFRQTLRSLMQGSKFKDFLITGANDRLLTDKWVNQDFMNARFNVLYPDYNRMEIETYLEVAELRDQDRDLEARELWEEVSGNLRRASAREPLELIAYVVERDRDYTEILTADYTVVNPMLSEAYDSRVTFNDPGNPNEWRRGRNRGQISPDDSLQVGDGDGFREYVSGGLDVAMPHAGILNTPAFLSRYPSTATNRNRARARWTYYHFLGLDIEAAASRPTDPEALADTDNPTLKNPACAVCHTTMDPVAGSFQNYGDEGFFRDEWGGQDSLPASYKRSRESGYEEGDTWYRDMRIPGFEGQDAPSNDNSLQWLAGRITKDPRFASATVKFWWPAIMGRDPMRAPQAATDADYPQRLAAFEAQNGDIEELGVRFRTNANGGKYKLKDLLVDMVMSPWFRADGLKRAVSPEQEELLALAEVGSERLLTPEQLDQKIQAILGFTWQERDVYGRPGVYRTGFSDEYRLYYGGIDSDGIAQRQREMTSIMNTVVASFAAESACSIIDQDIQRNANNRMLFREVEPTDSPDLEVSEVSDVRPQDIDSARAYRVTVDVAAGAKQLRVGFPNDLSENGEDRNLYINEMALKSGNRVLAEFDMTDTTSIEGFSSSTTCNRTRGDSFALNCRGEFTIPVTVESSGPLTLEVNAHASRAGDGFAQVLLAIDSMDMTAETATSKDIRRLLVGWFDRLHGMEVKRNGPEVDRAMVILRETQAMAQARGSDINHRPCTSTTGLQDNKKMLPAWKAMLVYFLTDYRFIYE